MSSMMDLASALGGGGGPPPGLAPAGPTGIGAPPPAAGPPDDSAGGAEQFATSLDALDAAEQALHAFIQLDPDDIDRAQAGQALSIVLKLHASNQKSVQSGDMKGLQRALAGGGAYAAGGPPGA